MKYRIIIEKRVEKETRRIPKEQLQHIDRAILSLAENPRPFGSKKLTEKEGYRIRIGNYRVLYTVDDEMKMIAVYRVKIKGKRTYE